jgi:hypothetical protein
MGLLRDSQGRGIDEYNPLATKLEESVVSVPFDHQYTWTGEAPTHTGVLIANSQTNTQSTWQQVPEGMTEFIINHVAEGFVPNLFTHVQWSNDQSTVIGKTNNATATAQAQQKTSTQWYPVGGAFYKGEIYNGDATPHTCSMNIKFRP